MLSGPLIACLLEAELGQRAVKQGTIDVSEIAAVRSL